MANLCLQGILGLEDGACRIPTQTSATLEKRPRQLTLAEDLSRPLRWRRLRLHRHCDHVARPHVREGKGWGGKGDHDRPGDSEVHDGDYKVRRWFRLRKAYLSCICASHPETVLCNIRPTNEQAKKLAMGSYIE